MPKKSPVPCLICNPSDAVSGDYCETHREELHRLDHQYESLFRLQRISRGKGHESYNIFMKGECEPCGRVFVAETDPDNLSISVMISEELDLDARILEYANLMIEMTYGDQLRRSVEEEVVHSWYGSARACIDIYKTSINKAMHWDVAPRQQEPEEDESRPHSAPRKKPSVH